MLSPMRQRPPSRVRLVWQSDSRQVESDDMDGLEYWRLCDQLDIVQAALLVCGHDPSADQSYVEEWTPDNRPPGYEAAKTAISNALRKGLIEGQFICSNSDSI